MNLFKVDTPIYNVLSRIVDFIVLNLLWILCSLPIITAGASSAALYYCMMKIVRGTDSEIIKKFFYAFKQNLKQGSCLMIILLMLGAFLCVDLHVCVTIGNTVTRIIGIILRLMLIIWIVIVSYGFPLLAQFDNTIKNIIKNALVMGVLNIKKTIMIVVFNSIPIILFLAFPYFFILSIPIWLIGGISLISYINARQFVKIFNKYINQLD